MLALDLRHHCIETAIRKRYDQALYAYFKEAGARPQLDKDIELLLEALETLYFSTLRSTHRPLAGHTKTRITLSRDEQGHLSIGIGGQPVPTLPKR